MVYTQQFVGETSLMKIEAFTFGSITIEGKTYTGDVIVYPDRVDESWPREEEYNS